MDEAVYIIFGVVFAIVFLSVLISAIVKKVKTNIKNIKRMLNSQFHFVLMD